MKSNPDSESSRRFAEFLLIRKRGVCQEISHQEKIAPPQGVFVARVASFQLIAARFMLPFPPPASACRPVDMARADVGPSSNWRISYVCSPLLLDSCSKLECSKTRASSTHELLKSFELLQEDLTMVSEEFASQGDLRLFHSEDYIVGLKGAEAEQLRRRRADAKKHRKLRKKAKRTVQRMARPHFHSHSSDDEGSSSDSDSDSDSDSNSSSSSSDSSSEDEDEDEDEDEFVLFGFDDCVPFPGLFGYCRRICGAAIAGVRELYPTEWRDLLRRPLEVEVDGDDDDAVMTVGPSRVGDSRICLSLYGTGRHHARRSKAAGFCFVNDVVLTALLFAKIRKRVLIVDVGSLSYYHHGDGVQNAFLYSKNVLTISFHHYGRGIYPGTGRLESIGKGAGKGYNINVPLRDGLNDENFLWTFDAVVPAAFRAFRPDVVILVAGADGMVGDEIGKWNLTERSFHAIGTRLRSLLEESPRTRLLVLGGGGYVEKNVAMAWFALTWSLVRPGRELPNMAPLHCSVMGLFAPGFQLSRPASRMKDYNEMASLRSTTERIVQNIRQYIRI